MYLSSTVGIRSAKIHINFDKSKPYFVFSLIFVFGTEIDHISGRQRKQTIYDKMSDNVLRSPRS